MCGVCVLLVSSNESLKIFPSGPKLLKAQSVMEFLNFDFGNGIRYFGSIVGGFVCVCVCSVYVCVCVCGEGCEIN